MPFLSMWDKQGHLIRTWDISATNSTPRGITTDRKYLWLMNSEDNQLEQRDKQSHLIEQVGITLASDLRGDLTTDRKYLWYCDTTNSVAVLVDKQGHEIRQIATTDPPYGITTDRKYLWITEFESEVGWWLRQYDKQGHLIQSINLTLITVKIEPGGITTDRKYLWITDTTSQLVHQLDKQGHIIDSWACAPEDESPYGITTDRKYLWITSLVGCEWCEEDVLYERYNTGDNWSKRIYDRFWWAQTFTIGNTGANVNHHLCRLRLKLCKAGNISDLSVAVQGVDGAFAPDGVNISTGTIPAATITALSCNTWYYVTMTDVELLANTQYAIVCNTTGGDSSNCIHWCADTIGSLYAGGMAWDSTDSGATWDDNIIADMMFEEYGDITCY